MEYSTDLVSFMGITLVATLFDVFWIPVVTVKHLVPKIKSSFEVSK